MEKLLKIQTELKVPKENYNTFGKYKFRSAEDILEAVKPLLEKYNCVLNLYDDIVEVGGRVYVKAIADIRDLESDKAFRTESFARESETKKGMDDSQITGSASSYARKYALGGLFLIDDGKDADSTNEQKEEKKAKQPIKKPQSSSGKITVNAKNKDGEIFDFQVTPDGKEIGTFGKEKEIVRSGTTSKGKPTFYIDRDSVYHSVYIGNVNKYEQ